MFTGRKRCVGGAIPEAFATDWRRKAREVGEAANIALIVAKKHDADALAEAGERIDVSCDQCHERYQLLDDDPTDNNDKVWGTVEAEGRIEGEAGDATARLPRPLLRKTN